MESVVNNLQAASTSAAHGFSGGSRADAVAFLVLTWV